MIQLSTLLDLNTLILMQRASKHKTHPYAFISTGGLSFSDLSLVSDFSLIRTTHSQQGMGLVTSPYVYVRKTRLYTQDLPKNSVAVTVLLSTV